MEAIPLLVRQVSDGFCLGGRGQFELDDIPFDSSDGDLSRFSVEIKLRGDGVVPFHRLVKFEGDLIPFLTRKIGLFQIGSGDGDGEDFPVNIPLKQRRHQEPHFLIVVRFEVAIRPTGNLERGHDAQAGIALRQLPLHLAQLVAVPGSALRTGVRIDLEKIVVSQIRIVLFPSGGQIDPVLLIGLAPITVVGTVKPLIRFSLMPEKTTHAVGKFGGDNALFEVFVDGTFLW